MDVPHPVAAEFGTRRQRQPAIIGDDGDLDGDKKLDLVVNLNRKYSVHPYRLLLSSMASGSQMVGEAAVFETSD